MMNTVLPKDQMAIEMMDLYNRKLPDKVEQK